MKSQMFLKKLESRAMKLSPHAEAYLRFLRLSTGIVVIPGFEHLDANHKALFEAAAVHWAAGEPLTVREMIDQSELGSPATLHKRLQSLIAQDFLKAESEAADRRTKYISPTPKGLKYAHWIGDKLLKSTMATRK